MFEIYSTWISPGLWLVLSLLWVVPSIMALRWPGGAGAVILLIGTVGNVLCFLLSAADGYTQALSGNNLIEWDSKLWVLHESLFIISFALQFAGLFVLVMRVKPMMQRLCEFEALPPQG